MGFNSQSVGTGPGWAGSAAINPDTAGNSTAIQRQQAKAPGSVKVEGHQAPQVQQAEKSDPTALANEISDELGQSSRFQKKMKKLKGNAKDLKSRTLDKVNRVQKTEKYDKQQVDKKAEEFCKSFTNVNQQVLKGALNELARKHRGPGGLKKEDISTFAKEACRGKDATTKVFLLDWLGSTFFEDEDDDLKNLIADTKDEILETEIAGTPDQKEKTLKRAKDMHTQLSKSRGVVGELGMTHRDIDAGLRLFLGRYPDTAKFYEGVKSGTASEKKRPGGDRASTPPMDPKSMQNLFGQWTHLIGSMLQASPPPSHAFIINLQELRQDMNNVKHTTQFMAKRLDSIVTKSFDQAIAIASDRSGKTETG